MPSLCTGCHQTFTSRGFASHVAQATQEICRAQHRSQLAQATQVRPTLFSPPIQQDPPTPRQFQGDYFGPASSYAAEDFEWSEDEGDEHEEPEGSMDENGSDDEDLDAELQESLRSHWEPALPVLVEPTTYSNMSVEYGTLTEDGVAPVTPSTFSPQRRERLEAALCRTIHRTCFPSEVAGKRITSRAAGYGDYASKVKDGQPNRGPYAPFLSKLESDVAMWAKLRGPGSTALTELLSIEGVSLRSTVSPQYLV